MKTCLVCIARKENPYLREWVEWHLGIGFSKVVVCDNGFGNEASPTEAIGDYAERGVVDIVDMKGQKFVQAKAYTECYSKYGGCYDWIAFFDVDEFLVLPMDGDVRRFLGRFPKDAQLVSVNWQIMTDGGLLRNDGRKVMERFVVPMEKFRQIHYGFPENRHVKPIVRGGIERVEFCNPHAPKTKLVAYHSNFKRESQGYFHDIDWSNAILRHFVTKTIEEWCLCKIPRQDPLNPRRKYTLDEFFMYNERTAEKMKVAEEVLGRNG